MPMKRDEEKCSWLTKKKYKRHSIQMPTHAIEFRLNKNLNMNINDRDADYE